MQLGDRVIIVQKVHVFVCKASLLEDMSHVHSLVQLGSGLFNPLNFFFRQVRNVLDVLDFLDAFSFRSSAIFRYAQNNIRTRTNIERGTTLTSRRSLALKAAIWSKLAQGEQVSRSSFPTFREFVQERGLEARSGHEQLESVHHKTRLECPSLGKA